MSRFGWGVVLGLALSAWWATPSLGGQSPARNPPIAAVDPSALSSAAHATNAFAFDLYERIRASGNDEVFSPLSIEVALAMTSAGARGDTKAEMERVLYTAATPKVHQSFAGLLWSLKTRDGQDGLELRIASRLWGQSGYAFKRTFIDLLGAQFRAPLGDVDFVRSTEAARVSINDWVSHQTNGRIPRILEAGAMDDWTRLVVTNAVYFHGLWRYPFNAGMTRDADFEGLHGKGTVRMMRNAGSFAYAHLDGVQLVELPYRGGLSMVIVLPDSPTGLPDVEQRLRGSYERWTLGLAPKRVHVLLPRWTSTRAVSLAPHLAAMGMPTALVAGRADLSGIADGESLYISQVVHQAFIETNEKGTEAAAATAVVVSAACGTVEPDPIVFRTDHPFAYFIRDSPSGAILFMGRMVDPTGPAAARSAKSPCEATCNGDLMCLMKCPRDR
jgi:serpin B